MGDAFEQESVLRRYGNSISLAEKWLEENGRSQAWLAKQIGVDRTLLCRYLQHDQRVYAPGAGRKRMLEILHGIERICSGQSRDVFISHRSTDKEFARRLAADIESQQFGDRHLTVWLDEAEIRPGQSVPEKINAALESSRFVALIMTPDYFQSPSGWTDAEWQSVLGLDPNNRRAKLIPVLATNCPYIPALLRHLLTVDCRESKYSTGLAQILRVLWDEPLPRTVSHRGQLLVSTHQTSLSTLLAERAVPDADPDIVAEKVDSNLLPIERLPRYVYVAPIAPDLLKTTPKGRASHPDKKRLISRIRSAQEEAGIESPRTPSFRVHAGRIVTFHDLDSPESTLSPVVDNDAVQVFKTEEFFSTDVKRNLVLSLLNMAIARRMQGRGLIIDGTKFNRFFFPPDDGKPRVVEWRPTRNKAKRTVAKPFVKNDTVTGWLHHACYIKALYLASHFYIQLTPTRVLTSDGSSPQGGTKVGRTIVRWLGQERNLHVLYNIRFWISVLRGGPGPIGIRAGDQWIEAATAPAFIQQAYGIRSDQRDLLGLLDEEAHLIEREEEHEEIDVIALDEADDLSESDEIDADSNLGTGDEAEQAS